jgi:HAMP domain-containing protein
MTFQPRLSIAGKLYAIFALLAMTSLASALPAILGGGDKTTLWLAGGAIVLAALGTGITHYSFTKPLVEIIRTVEKVAAGDATIAIPYADRLDEVGAFSRSIGLCQDAVRRSEQLNSAAIGEAESRARPGETISTQIRHFGEEVEITAPWLIR